VRLLNVRPHRGQEFALRARPFVATAAAYLIFSALRLAEKPADKLLPALGTMADSLCTLALHADPRTGDYVFWLDTFASLQRLIVALGLATPIALVAGVATGLLPLMGALLNAFVAVVSMAPPLALLPILFITLGLGETSKIALILIGTAPVMIRDLTMRVGELPREQLLKAQTLGASTWQIALRVVLPRLIDSARLQLGPGRSSVALVAWNARGTSERLNHADTVKAQESAGLRNGRVILSDMGKVVFSIPQDTSGAHDALVGGSTAASNARKYGGDCRNTRDNFRFAAAKLGLSGADMPQPVVFFAPVEIDAQGRFVWNEAKRTSDDFIDLRAEMDLLFALSNTPHPFDPAPEYAPGAIEAIRFRLPTPLDDYCRTGSAEAVRAFQNNAAAALA
jgi:urea carboxylase-associated protein 2